MVHRAVIFFLIGFFISSVNQGYAESGKPPAQPANPGRSLVYPFSDTDEIIGSWTFVYFKEYRSLADNNPPPPKFDVITISSPDVLNVVSRVYETDRKGRYEGSGSTIFFHLDSTEKSSPLTYSYECLLANHGKAMILEADGIEIVYFRSSRMLENDIPGEWSTGIGDQKKVMMLTVDGVITFTPGQTVGFYRLWPSRHGSTITASLYEPGFGYSVSMWQYEEKGNNLILTAIDKTGELVQPLTVWKKETKAP